MARAWTRQSVRMVGTAAVTWQPTLWLCGRPQSAGAIGRIALGGVVTVAMWGGNSVGLNTVGHVPEVVGEPGTLVTWHAVWPAARVSEVPQPALASLWVLWGCTTATARVWTQRNGCGK
jgi:hypothetical protein